MNPQVNGLGVRPFPRAMAVSSIAPHPGPIRHRELTRQTGATLTLQAEQPIAIPEPGPSDRRSRHGRLIAIALAAALVAGAAAVLGLASGDDNPPPKPVVLGQSLSPVKVYRVHRFSEPRAAAHPGKTERAVAVLGRPGMVAVINEKPDQLLHVQYAHVRTVGGAIQIEMAAPREAAFHESRTGEQHYVAVVDGKATALFFVFGSADQTNFAVAGGANPISRAEAIAFAHRSTTAVLADH